MNDELEQSCWGVASWTLAGIGIVLLAVYLLGGFDTAVVAAN